MGKLDLAKDVLGEVEVRTKKTKGKVFVEESSAKQKDDWL